MQIYRMAQAACGVLIMSAIAVHSPAQARTALRSASDHSPRGSDPFTAIGQTASGVKISITSIRTFDDVHRFQVTIANGGSAPFHAPSEDFAFFGPDDSPIPISFIDEGKSGGVPNTWELMKNILPGQTRVAAFEVGRWDPNISGNAVRLQTWFHGSKAQFFFSRDRE